jgi:DNA-binding CsgD family transcriptional regulator
MKVFISWSGKQSEAVASALREWLPYVIQTVEPWMSGADIHAGARWGREVSHKLSETSFGIICLTKANQNKPWIHFEAGAVSKTILDTFVVPYLIDLEPEEIHQGPLNQFQAKRASQEETWELIVSINRAQEEGVLPDDKLRRIFDRWWPDLEATVKALPPDSAPAEPERQVDDMVVEILGMVRELSRRVPSVIGGIPPELPEPSSLSRLTPAETRVFQYAMAGHSTRSIASAMGVEPASIRAYLSRIYGKLGVSNMSELTNLQSDSSIPSTTTDEESL